MRDSVKANLEHIFSFHEDEIDEATNEEFYSRSLGITISDKLTEEKIKIIRQKFLDAVDQSFAKTEFQFILEDIIGTIAFPSEDDYNMFFKKMDYRRDDRVDWDEFVSYIILEFQMKDLFTGAATKELLELPISNQFKIIRSKHRHPVVRITYCPTVDNERRMNFHNGKYMTASKDGCIHYWSLDMSCERTVYSTCPELKVNATWVTDMVCMPDINIVCTSSTERDLRFYDTTAKRFELRVMISSLDNAVCCMHYHFSKNIKEESILILGDMGGSILIMSFNSLGKGPFAQKPGIDILHLRYNAVLKGHLKGLKVYPFLNVHSNWVNQVAYYPVLKSFVSCCQTPEVSMVICDIAQTRKPYKFHVPTHGVSCFAFNEDSHVVVTGGSDSIVRVWNPFVPSKASSSLKGHHAAICGIVIQRETSMLYTISKDRVIKVWHLGTQACIQTFSGLCGTLGHTNISLRTFYNPETHVFFIASTKIALIVCEKVIKDIYTDGYTHTKAVIKAMYNPLFKCLITLGMDSSIMTWDLWLGKRIFVVKKAHTQLIYGEIHEVEITAGTFDPSYTLLLTGARDGTLKIWNFNNGTCIRNMSIENNCRVTNVMWIPNRILAVGWNRHVTEFADNVNVGDGKNWEKRHTEDILASCVRTPEALVTSSYCGELIFWRLETGQPYKKFNVADPERKHQIDFKKSLKGDVSRNHSNHSKSSVRMSVRPSTVMTFQSKPLEKHFSTMSQLKIRNKSGSSSSSSSSVHSVHSAHDKGSYGDDEISLTDILEEVAIHATLFLCARPMAPHWGTLLVSLENGLIQLWSHHKVAGLITQFDARCTSDEYVISMATDPNNQYLFTGDTFGHIRVWLLANFGVPEEHRVKINIGLLKKKFSYFARMFYDEAEPIKYPLLLTSYQGHVNCVTHIEYLPDLEIVISCSVDHTVRLWTLQGQYIGTLGTTRPWPKLFLDRPPDLREFRIPPDIKRIASETTLKVIGYNPNERHGSIEQSLIYKLISKELAHEIHGFAVKEPILGDYFSLPSRGKRCVEIPAVDITVGPHIQVFTFLRTHETTEVQDIKPPPALAAAMKTKDQKRDSKEDVKEESSTSLKNSTVPVSNTLMGETPSKDLAEDIIEFTQ